MEPLEKAETRVLAHILALSPNYIRKVARGERVSGKVMAAQCDFRQAIESLRRKHQA